MNEKQILKKLKNDHEYYNGIGKNYLSNSNIQALTTEPRQFQAPQRDGEAFVKGRYFHQLILTQTCLLYTSPSPRDRQKSRMPSSA